MKMDRNSTYRKKQANDKNRTISSSTTNDSSGSNHKTTTNFESLPDLVHGHICKYLDVSSLMNLRLTCGQLKSAVEQAAVLENLPIRVFSSKQLQRILESKVPYNNFILSFKFLDQQSYLKDFAVKFGPFIKKLNITTFTGICGNEKVLQLLEKCTRLKELEVKTMFTTYQQKSRFENALRNLRGLRKLTIHRILGAKNGHEEINFFLNILNNCKHLEEFKVPVIDSYNKKMDLRRKRKRFPRVEIVENQDHVNNEMLNDDDEDWEDWEQEAIQISDYDPFPDWNDDDRDILIYPILNYIRSKTNMKFPPMRRINIEEISKFELETFKDLVQVCYEYDIRLFGLKGTQIFDFMDDKMFSDGKYGRMIHSAHLQSYNNFPFSILENLQSLYLFVSNFREPLAVSGEYSDLTLPRLKNLQLQFVCGVESPQSQQFIEKLFRASMRPTVERLQLDFLTKSYSTLLSRDLVNNFKNLKELDLRSWDAKDSEFCLLWINLSGLEKIVISYCKNITNKAFVGDYNLNDDRNIDQRPLNRLKKLKRLTIHDLFGKVNEIAMMDSFRWIKLQYFEYSSTVISEIREDVYRALMLAPLGRCVEYFNVPQPSSRSHYFQKRTLMQGFKNLKRRVPW